MVLERIDWNEASEKVRKQQRNRESFTPTISVFRWWARRSHALFGALLDGAIHQFGPGIAVSDPFSGGGTVAVEAVRRRLEVYAQDLQPWAVWGLATVLDHADPNELERAGSELLARLERHRTEHYSCTCPEHGPSEIVHTYWVRRSICPACEETLFLYPNPLLTYSERIERKTPDDSGFFGCSRCGNIVRANRDAADVSCNQCGYRLGEGNKVLVKQNKFSCPHCLREISSAELVGFDWSPVLVQRYCGHGKSAVLHIDTPTQAEYDQATRATYPESLGPLGERIPLGRETRRLISWGYSRWSDLYPARQLVTYLKVAEELADMPDLSGDIRRRLLLLLCGAPEMAGFSSRWDRFHLKAFEATANHRFSAPTFAVEVNPLGPRGRGTLYRRLGHTVKAARWMRQQEGAGTAQGAQIRIVGQDVAFAIPSTTPTVVVGSSERQLLADHSVQLVLTDPPYFDDVQYGELARPFLAWARHLGLCPGDISVDLSREAVPNEHRDVNGHGYMNILRSIFSEVRRTLQPSGRLIITYHNSKADAWAALGRALHLAGFSIIGIATVHAENETDHAKRNRLAFSKDLVLECCDHAQTGQELWVQQDAGDEEAQELLAMGRALALNPGSDTGELFNAFATLLGTREPQRILINR